MIPPVVDPAHPHWMEAKISALHYGDILHALGEEFMAKTYWRKALERGADKEEIERRFMPKAEESQPKRVQPKR